MGVTSLQTPALEKAPCRLHNPIVMCKALGCRCTRKFSSHVVSALHTRGGALIFTAQENSPLPLAAPAAMLRDIETVL